MVRYTFLNNGSNFGITYFPLLALIHTVEGKYKGRIIKIECKNKATQSLYNIVGFYGFPSSWDKNLRKTLIKKLGLALSSDITQIPNWTEIIQVSRIPIGQK